MTDVIFDLIWEAFWDYYDAFSDDEEKVEMVEREIDEFIAFDLLTKYTIGKLPFDPITDEDRDKITSIEFSDGLIFMNGIADPNCSLLLPSLLPMIQFKNLETIILLDFDITDEYLREAVKNNPPHDPLSWFVTYPKLDCLVFREPSDTGDDIIREVRRRDIYRYRI